MINYLKITLRNLKQNKGFALINIIGLGIAMAASILISLWIFDELSYDRFNEKSDRIYRVERKFTQNGKSSIVPVTSAVYADKIREEYPQLEQAVRLLKRNASVINNENVKIREKVFFADNNFFEIFSIPLLYGNTQSVLRDPLTIVLTKTGAEKYFGKTNPINQILSIEISGQKMNFMVKGIMEDIPDNCHFHFDVLISFSTLVANQLVSSTSWNDNNLYTYLLLKEGVKQSEFETKLQSLIASYINPARIQILGNLKNISEIKLVLQPITKIHFNDDSYKAIEPNRNKGLIYLFSFFSLLILLMASFNYVNLSTAIAGKRSLEVGVRKTMGAAKQQLVLQFIGESMILSLIALGLAFFLIEITLPYFNLFTDKSLSLVALFNKGNILFIFLIVLITGFLSGIYPAFYLSSFKPISVLKGKSKVSFGKFNFRQILVILQFSISIALIIGAFTANLQMNYFRNKPLGFDRENILIVSLGNSYVKQHFGAFRNDLIQHRLIKNLSTSSSAPTINSFSDNRYSISTHPGENFSFWFYSIDESYFQTYGIELIAGQDFSKEQISDTKNKCIVNESVLPILGIASPEEAIGKTIMHHAYMGDKKEQIIGVVADYHLHALDKKIKPMVHYLNENTGHYLSLKYETGKSKDVLVLLENVWENHFPNNQLSTSILQNRYDNLYLNERKAQQLLLAFTILAIFIACMGLFGLVAYIIQQKTKEIGIRKVHGASNMVIVNFLNSVFIKWVLIANLISWPIAYYFLDEWLANFYYRINLPLWVFIVSGFISVLIAIITVSVQSYKAASLNPVDALRYE